MPHLDRAESVSNKACTARIRKFSPASSAPRLAGSNEDTQVGARGAGDYSPPKFPLAFPLSVAIPCGSAILSKFNPFVTGDRAQGNTHLPGVLIAIRCFWGERFHDEVRDTFGDIRINIRDRHQF